MPTKLGKPHEPKFLQNDYKKKFDTAAEMVRKGLPPKNALKAMGVHEQTWYSWVRFVEEDIEAGFTNTPLVKFMTRLAAIDEETHQDLVGEAISKAKDGDSQLLMFLLKTRYGYKDSKKQEVELSTKEDAPVVFNVVDMKPLDNDE